MDTRGSYIWLCVYRLNGHPGCSKTIRQALKALNGSVLHWQREMETPHLIHPAESIRFDLRPAGLMNWGWSGCGRTQKKKNCNKALSCCKITATLCFWSFSHNGFNLSHVWQVYYQVVHFFFSLIIIIESTMQKSFHVCWQIIYSIIYRTLPETDGINITWDH